MANIFDKWDESIDNEGLQNDVAEAAQNNGGNREEVPHGSYEVAIKQMELKATKKGDPMVSIWFKVVEGPHKNGIIFFNQVVTQGFQIHIVNELLRKMVSEAGEKGEDVETQLDAWFTSKTQRFTYSGYSNLILDVFEITDDFEYGLKYGKGKNDFSTYEITDVFALEG